MRLQRQRKARGREEGDAPQAKGTKKRQSQGNSYLSRAKGAGVMYKSCSWPTNPGRGEGRRRDKPIEKRDGEGKVGKASLKLPASSRLTASCTFLLLPPGSSSSPQQTIAPFLLDQKWSMAFSFHIALQTARSLADSSQGKREGLRAALIRATPQGWPEADRGDGVCRSFVVPALDRRNRVPNPSLRSTSLT